MISDSEDLQISVIDMTQLKAIWQISDRRSLFGAPNALKFAKNYDGVQETKNVKGSVGMYNKRGKNKGVVNISKSYATDVRYLVVR